MSTMSRPWIVYNKPNKAQAKLWNYYNKGDLLPAIRHWPLHFQKMGTSPHLNNREGYRFALFLLTNGLNPIIVKERLINDHTFDVYQANNIIKKWNNQTIVGTSFDMSLGLNGQVVKYP